MIRNYTLDDVNSQGELVSDSGIEYSLVEGFAFPNGQYTSDIVFIIDYTNKPSGILVGWLYGANNPNIMDDISEIINDYEQTGKRLI